MNIPVSLWIAVFGDTIIQNVSGIGGKEADTFRMGLFIRYKILSVLGWEIRLQISQSNPLDPWTGGLFCAGLQILGVSFVDSGS